jgi:hypothetical protein
MAPKMAQKVPAGYLRSAQPRLICRVETKLGGEWPPDALRKVEEVVAFRRASKSF